jgi:hypothetical protein
MLEMSTTFWKKRIRPLQATLLNVSGSLLATVQFL